MPTGVVSFGTHRAAGITPEAVEGLLTRIRGKEPRQLADEPPAKAGLRI
jgi:hypothetical protein